MGGQPILTYFHSNIDYDSDKSKDELLKIYTKKQYLLGETNDYYNWQLLMKIIITVKSSNIKKYAVIDRGEITQLINDERESYYKQSLMRNILPTTHLNIRRLDHSLLKQEEL